MPEVVVEVHALVNRIHNAQQSKDSRLMASGEESTIERSSRSGDGRKPHGCTTKYYYIIAAEGLRNNFEFHRSGFP